MKYQMSSKPGQIVYLRITFPLIAEKSLPCHQHNTSNFVWIFLKLADKVDRNEFSDELETRPDQISILRVVSLCGKKAST